jgi:hypothetical protein
MILVAAVAIFVFCITLSIAAYQSMGAVGGTLVTSGVIAFLALAYAE